MSKLRELQARMAEFSGLFKAHNAAGTTQIIQKALAAAGLGRMPGSAAAPVAEAEAEAGQAVADGAKFVSASYTAAAGTRRYKVYIPSTYHGQAMPLVVMLHGCTQDPDDFARGTRMNALAEENGFVVAYPAQESSANSSRCWNWFKAIDQQRGQGEPSLIAGLTNQVIEQYQLDRSKVYVAGLSAGGAMAVIMGSTYPDLYRAVGVHSGLPYASASDLPSALSAMKGLSHRRSAAAKAVPIIVFHGDRDATVSPSNATVLMDDFVAGFEGADQISTLVEQGQAAGGRRFSRTTLHAPGQAVLAEHWVVHGAGHAWAGGSSQGTYTDAEGPDASREMFRFFSTQASPAA